MAGKVARLELRSRFGGRSAANGWQVWALAALEALAWGTIALIGVVVALGIIADRFAGAGGSSDSLLFAGSILVLGLCIAFLGRGWLAVRRVLGRQVWFAPATAALAAAAAAGWFATGERFWEQAQSFRTMVGAKQAAAKSTIAHQVFAAYRRLDLGQMEMILERGRVFEPTIQEAAQAFGVEPEVLVGVGATESSFYPRKSADGGQGIFQITAPPSAALTDVHKRLGIKKLDPLNQRHNAFVGAATLRRYLDEMKSDLFLGLLAYNIGPRNGGLKTIMRQYGARDFTTIQPYLQNLPREYPIRVLSAALAYRVWRTEGRLSRYEKDGNARRIQRIGIPGIDTVAEKTG